MLFLVCSLGLLKAVGGCFSVVYVDKDTGGVFFLQIKPSKRCLNLLFIVTLHITQNLLFLEGGICTMAKSYLCSLSCIDQGGQHKEEVKRGYKNLGF